MHLFLHVTNIILRSTIITLLVGFFFSLNVPAHAETEGEIIARYQPANPDYDATGNFTSKAKFAYLYDYTTGTVLYEKDAFKQMGPSSMTKLMTAYLVFEALKKGQITMESKLPVSEHAWRQQGSKMFVKVGTEVSVEDLIRGVIVQSGNDACVVLAEGLGGNEANFIRMMNEKAKEMNLEQTHFMNPNGMPDPQHVMSAGDLVKLSVRLYEDFPEYMKFYKLTEFTYNDITQASRNRLLHRNIGVDGFKTGFTNDNGYGITVTAEQNGRRIFLVVNGLESSKERMVEAEKMVRYAFSDFKLVRLYKKGDVIENADVWLGNQAKIPLVAAKDIQMLVPARAMDKKNFKIQITYNNPIYAPIKKGDEIAEMVVLKDGKKYSQIPLQAGADVAKQGFAASIIPRAQYFITGIYN